MPQAKKICFHYQDVSFPFTHRELLKAWLMKLFKKEGRQIDHINYIFCTDSFLLTLNQQYLSHNTLTDIITFELSAPGDILVADIYISVERVKENTLIFKTPFYRELHRVIFHGALHLCGYKDKTTSDSEKMRKAEEKCLTQYFR